MRSMRSYRALLLVVGRQARLCEVSRAEGVEGGQPVLSTLWIFTLNERLCILYCVYCTYRRFLIGGVVTGTTRVPWVSDSLFTY